MAASTDNAQALRHDCWALAFASVESLQEPALVDAPHWLEPPRGRFYADPFLVVHQDQPWVFFEEYLAAAGQGRIAASPLREFAPRPVLVKDWHLSYPFLIEDQGELFCLPEQHQAGKVSLYRCLRFPDVWCQEAVLLDDFAGVDPTVIRHQDRYWMWIGHQDRRARDHTFVFHAARLTGPWMEHSMSPAISRADLARPAGKPWQEGGRWFRPAQDRRQTYGGGIVVYEVERLTPDHYQEREVACWQPNPDWGYPDGLHHLCHSDGLMVWDAKRFVKEI